MTCARAGRLRSTARSCLGGLKGSTRRFTDQVFSASPPANNPPPSRGCVALEADAVDLDAKERLALRGPVEHTALDFDFWVARA